MKGLDGHWDPSEVAGTPSLAERIKIWNESEFQTFHVRMRDGVNIAVDVFLPSSERVDRSRGLPVLFHQTRYWRSMTARKYLRWIPFVGDKPIDVVNLEAKQLAIAAGMAVVSMDVRGTGASGGVWRHPWHPSERCDSLEVLMWALAQPWSDGRAVLFGMSYDATAALHTAAFGHPGVVGVALRYPFWDLYSDVSFPGGVPPRSFPSRWSQFTTVMDSRRLGCTALCVKHTPVMIEVPSPLVASGLVSGDPPSVDGSRDTVTDDRAFRPYRSMDRGTKREFKRVGSKRVVEATASRHNWTFRDDLDHVRCADDPAPSSDNRPFWTGSACLFADRLGEMDLDVYVETGWMDITVGASEAIYRRVGKGDLSELVVGPWGHGGLMAQHQSHGLHPAWNTFPQIPPLMRFVRRCLAKHVPDSTRALPLDAALCLVRWMEARPESGTEGAPPVPKRRVGWGWEAWSRRRGGEPLKKGSSADSIGYPLDLSRPGRRVMVYEMGPAGACGWGEVDAEGGLQGRGKEVVWMGKGESLHSKSCHSLSPTPPTAPFSVSHDTSRVPQLPVRNRIGLVALPFVKMHYGTVFTSPGFASFCTPPLASTLRVMGSVQVDVHLKCDKRDVAVFAVLLDEAPGHAPTYVGEGALRAAHRRSHPAPPKNDPRAGGWVPGTVFHTFSKSDVEPSIPGEVVCLSFSLMPVSYAFSAGHRLRLALFASERANFAGELHEEVAEAREGAGAGLDGGRKGRQGRAAAGVGLRALVGAAGSLGSAFASLGPWGDRSEREMGSAWELVARDAGRRGRGRREAVHVEFVGGEGLESRVVLPTRV